MQRRGFLASLAATGVVSGVSVRDHGATGDGSKLDTKPVQSAIDAVANRGGGVVLFPPGRYLSGTLILRSRVTLHLADGSTIVGSRNLADYPERVPKVRSYTDNYTDKSLLYAEDAERVTIEGNGVIDGSGAAFKGPYKVRPYTIRMIACRDVTVRNVRIVDSPMWVQHYLECDDVFLHGLRVHSRVNANNDGIDIDACSRVRISDCDIWSGDDAIVLKSTTARPCRDVTIANCVLSSVCNALKLGTESNGGFEDIAIANCTVYDTRLAGLAIECVDGGALARVMASNLTMRNVGCPLFVRLGDRGRPFKEGQERPGVGTLRDVSVTGLYATAATNIGCPIAGLPDRPVENVYLSNIDLVFPGGGTEEMARREIPQERDKYPEFRMFGPLPAYGLWSRHVRGLAMRDVRVRSLKPDARPPVAHVDTVKHA